MLSPVGRNVSSPYLAHISCRSNEYTPFTSVLAIQVSNRVFSTNTLHVDGLTRITSFGQNQVFGFFLAEIVCRSTYQT
jgi:hypothetical protein